MRRLVASASSTKELGFLYRILNVHAALVSGPVLLLFHIDEVRTVLFAIGMEQRRQFCLACFEFDVEYDFLRTLLHG